jgi:hypothetical protein
MPPKSPRKPATNPQPTPSRVSKAPVKPARPTRIAVKEKHYPWDSHQDDIIVNSVEERQPAYRTGVAHYLHLLAQQKSYEHITTDFDDYRRNFTNAEDLPNYDDEEREDREWEQQEGIDYTVLPIPPATLSAYSSTIYTAHTPNPAVFLAITRLAAHNLPFLDFSSSVSHLPNHSPAAPLPTLEKELFCADVPYSKKASDTEMSILFLPSFYEDGRHALGFYTFIPPANLSPSPAKALFQSVKNFVFAPYEC